MLKQVIGQNEAWKTNPTSFGRAENEEVARFNDEQR